MYIIFISLTVTFLLFPCVTSDKNIEINFVKDFLQTEVSKPLVAAFLCWDKGDKYEFSKMLFKNNFVTGIFDVNIKNIHPFLPAENNLYLIDFDCENSIELLKKASDEYLFYAPYKWLILSENSKILKEIDLNFSYFEIFPDSNVIVARKIHNKYFLTEVYRFNKTRREIVKKNVRQWTKEEGFDYNKLRILAVDRQNLNGTLLTSSIVIVNNDSLNHLDDYRDKHLDTISKVNYVFTNQLIDFVNGSRKFIIVDSWGYKYPNNNSFTGMVGSLQRSDAEIGGTAMFMTAERLPLVEYVAMTTPTKISFVFRQPPLSYVSNVFTLPFAQAVWICSFWLLILVSLLLYFAVLWEWRKPGLEEKPNALRDSFVDIVMLTIGAVAQQGTMTEPRSGAGQIIMIFTFITMMFLYVSYSANIVAILQTSATNIRTLEDLLNSRLKIGVHDIVYNHYYFETATDPIRKAIYQQKVAPPGQKPRFMPLEEGIKKLREGFFAFHMELGAGYKLVSDTFYEGEKCGLQEMKYIPVVDTYMAIKRNSTYKEMLKIGLRKIQETGIQSRELARLYTKRPECHSGGGSFVSVGLVDAYEAFVVWGVGLGISLLLLSIETIVYKKWKYYYPLTLFHST